METKKVKKRYKDEIYSHSNREVLVLSPNLLQKLGIHLGNIQSDTGGLINSTIELSNDLKVSNNSSIEKAGASFEKPCEYESSTETSILKTANLMKESVLLSPTFSALKNNEILNEEESMNINTSNIAIEDKQISSKNLKLYENNSNTEITYKDSLQSTKISSEIINNNDTNIYNVVATDCDVDILKPTNGLQDASENLPSENFELLLRKPLEGINAKTNLEPKNKINILSEEILDAKKIKELNFFPSSEKGVLIPVTKEIAISKSNSNINSTIFLQNLPYTKDQEIKNDRSDRTLNIDKTVLSHSKDIIKEPQQSGPISEIREQKLICENNTSNYNSVHKSNFIPNQKSMHIKKTIDLTSVHLKNESSLGDLSVSTNHIFVHNNSNEKDTENQTSDINLQSQIFPSITQTTVDTSISIQSVFAANQSKIDRGDDCCDKEINSEENIATSKLCIQGVEKPGGELNFVHYDTRYAKTYMRKKKTKSFNTIVNKKISNSLDNTFDIDYKTNDAEQNDQKYKKFCICNDFGNYSYYETAESYQHLHFLNRNHRHCQLDILFSIYEDAYNYDQSKNEISTERVDIFSEEERLEDESFNNIICLNNIENTYQNIDMCDDISAIEFTSVQEVTMHDDISILSLGNYEQNIQNETCNINPCIFQHQSTREVSPSNRIPTRSNSISISVASRSMSGNAESTEQSFNVTDSLKTKTTVDENKLTPMEETNSSENVVCEQNIEKLELITNVPKKRKRSSTSDSDDKPLAKKIIEKIVCGACDIEVAKVDWEQHISKKHCYIAWKEGETIDFEDKKLLKKLTKRLCETGKLVCTFCKYEHNEFKKFMRHVKKCVKKVGSSNKSKKPTITIDVTVESDHSAPQTTYNRLVCGVCQSDVDENLWIEHICKEHNYLAWEQDSPPLDCTDEDAVLGFLDITRKMIGQLECSHCGIKRKYVKSYINHMKQCANIELLPSVSTVYKEKESKTELDKNIGDSVLGTVKCGVCHIEVEGNKWIDHIRTEHSYLAWKEGEPELDFNDQTVVNDHLYNITKEIDGLLCPKCGLRRKYVKSYLTHFEKCDGTPNSQNTTLNDTINNSTSDLKYTSLFNGTTLDDSMDDDKIVKCGVCQKELEGRTWINHIQKEHAYMAWKEGDPVLNLDNESDVLQHLNDINKRYNGLICNKCGITRKYVKVFLSHTKTCDSTFVLDASINEERVKDKDSYECAVCNEVVDPKDWKSHAMKKHYNVAWVVGDYPIDLRNPNAVDIYLKEYRKCYKKLECLLCGVSRVSTTGFYAHVIQCGKSEEEVDAFKDYCDICNNKYLCIYKTHHLQMHKEQELAKERKISLQMKLESSRENETELVTEGRLAAKRARNFIGKYQTFEYTCASCGYGADEEKELEEHVCKIESGDLSDSEPSLNEDQSSGDESEDTEIDSDISDMEISRDRWRKHGDSRSLATRIKRIPFEIKNPKSYINQSAEEFRKEHYTSDTLYPQWRNCKYKAVPDDEVPKYMPPLENSCKVTIGQSDWRTFSRFEGTKENGVYTVFVGSSIQCVSWAPPHARDAPPHVLAASCHNAPDSPRLAFADTHAAGNMLQIWDFGDITTSDPKLVLGIAHDYGIVWAMDWCASGARDQLPEHCDTFQRLGLLATACSNGSAYIFSVPYPSTITDNDKIVYNLTPVAELRLSRGEREKFQATSISWSPQRGHSLIVVGYSDGTTALYDLGSESPLLVEEEDGMKIFYPYHDERAHNTCVTGVSTLAGRGAEGACAVSSASPSGAESVRRGWCPLRLRALVPCSAAVHSPHWPAALLAENDGIVNQAVNELDWWGSGQRLGAVHSCGACTACGALAAFAPPLLRLMTPHPAFSSLNKLPVAFINMAPLAKKRTKQKNDELAVKLEPSTYEDAVKIYGVEFKFIKELDKNRLQQINNKPREHCHERFPLADIPSMAFNPSPRHHKKLALATHAGIIFVISI